MAYNKARIIEAAQKSLNQGRISQAIVEYQQILRHEPKDQVTLMTIGDLFVRQGDTFQALEYFERLAQLYMNDGFITKAIAIYKKIAKLAPEETRPLERLAELYVQQGVLSEARPLYLQLAESNLRAGRHQQAVGLLKKLLEAEPENLRVQTRLSELYLVIGKPKEAVAGYLAAATRLLENRNASEAEKLARRALDVDPNHAGALTVRARCLAYAAKPNDAIQLLESLTDLDAGSEATSFLLELYLQHGRSDRAVKLARSVFVRHPKNYAPAHEVAVALLEAGEAVPAVELLGAVREAMIEGGEQERLSQALHSAAESLPGRLEPLEWLADLYRRTSDSFRLPETLNQLAAACVAAGEFDRARQIYEEILDRDPESEAARRSLNQVRAQMGLGPDKDSGSLRTAPAPFAEPAQVEARPAPSPEVSSDEETQRFVAQSLTDVDLFSSYGLTQKAITLLETVLERAPRHPVVLERLLDLNLGEGNDLHTAELAAQLEQIHLERGDAASAERFAELCRRYQRAAGVTSAELAAPPMVEAAPAEFAVPVVGAAPVVPEVAAVPVPVEANLSAEAAVHEVDLSEEWASLSQQISGAVGGAPAEAQASAAPPEIEIVAPPEEGELAPISVHDSAALRAALDAAARGRDQAPQHEPAVEYELELEAAPAAVDSAATPAVAEAPAAQSTTSVMSSDQFLSDIASEFGGTVPKAAPPPPAPSAEKVNGSAPSDTGPLHEVFNEFRAELGEMGVEDEDLETHYNLGIAYREMGLAEECIGEFQKVAKAVQNGRAFRYTMQCYTLLGLSFLEKGQPLIAVMWYDKALETPGLDSETILALRYDLGVAQELSGEPAAALKSFSLVYGMNIDYRDVAERISTLQKQR